MEKIFYERRVYVSVEDRNLSILGYISKIKGKAEFVLKGLKENSRLCFVTATSTLSVSLSLPMILPEPLHFLLQAHSNCYLLFSLLLHPNYVHQILFSEPIQLALCPFLLHPKNFPLPAGIVSKQKLCAACTEDVFSRPMIIDYY